MKFMRNLAALFGALLLAVPATAAGPKMSNSGGIGNGAFTPAGPTGEPCGSGATWCVNGTTGAITGASSTVSGKMAGAVAHMNPGAAPGSPADGDCWVVTLKGTFCQVNGSTIGPFVSVLQPGQFLTAGQTVAQLTSGAIDASVPINAAVAAGNVLLTLPCGIYKINSPIHITNSITRITGAQQGCVTVQQNFTTGSAFQVDGGATAGISLIVVDHMQVSMTSGVTKTSGSSFHANNAHSVYFNYITSIGDLIGVDLQGGVAQFTYMVDHAEIINAGLAGIRLTDDGTPANQVKDVYLSNISIGGSVNGLLLANSSGVYATNMDICCHGGTGVLFAPASGQNVNGSFFANVLSDENTSVNGAWAFANTGGFITETYLTNCWGSGSASGAGLVVGNPNTNVLTIKGFNAHSNWNAGIEIEGGSNITIDGAGVFYNSLVGANNQPGILIQGSATKVSVIGSNIGKGGYVQQVTPGVTNNQSYGVQIAGSASKVLVSLNQTSDNGLGTIVDTSTNSSTNLKVNNLP